MTCKQTRALFLWIIIATGCGVPLEAGQTSTGIAVARIADWNWQIAGTCESEGDDMTFTGLGDPMLSIGINIAGEPSAVGNISSASKGFVGFIGHPDVPKPDVSVAGNFYSVKGALFVGEGVHVDGDISITCE